MDMTLFKKQKWLLPALLIALAAVCVLWLFAAGVLGPGFDSRCTIYLADGRTASDRMPEELPPDLITCFSRGEKGEYYAVLPPGWDASRLRVYVAGAEYIRIGGTRCASGALVSLPQGEPITLRAPWAGSIRLTLRQTGGIPAMFIRTESGSCELIHSEKGVTEPGYLVMTDAEGNVVYDGDLSSVRIRGNVTSTYNKKPYQIKLDKRASLAGMSPSKTYVLLANALDRSEIRNTIALDMARYTDTFSFTPAVQSVDLYVNHDYKGTYLLTEKVMVDDDRLNIPDLESQIKKLNPDLDLDALPPVGDAEQAPGAMKYYEIPNMPDDTTGGFLVQINFNGRYATESSAFVTERDNTFTLQEPKYITRTEAEYLSALFQRIEDALYSSDGTNPDTGEHYTELVDLRSFVSRFLIAEVLDDYDGPYCYFYKDADSTDPMVYAGPVWDQDGILGTWLPQMFPSVLHLTVEKTQGDSWLTRAIELEDFRAEANRCYREVYRPAIRILLGLEEDPTGRLRSIDAYAAEVAVSAELDRLRWVHPLDEQSDGGRLYNAGTGDTFPEQIEFLKEYLERRMEALDAEFLP